MEQNKLPEQIIPTKAIIVCKDSRDDHVLEFESFFKMKGLAYEIIESESQEDIDIKFYDGENLVDHIGLPHKD
jgi:hypothetical protein